MKFGIQERDYQLLSKHLIEPVHALGGTVWIFGSRAQGQSRPFSDVDLLVDLPNKTQEGITKIRSCEQELSETHFPYKVDIVFLHQIAESYRESIEKQKIKIS